MKVLRERNGKATEEVSLAPPALPAPDPSTARSPKPFSARLADLTSHVVRWAFRATGTLLLLAVALLVAFAPLRLTESAQVTALKVFAVAVAGFLPAYLFVRFLDFRATALWDEYVLNLHRLKMDDTANLPGPPRNSIYYNEWEEKVGGPDRGPLERTIYQEKFEAYFGKIVTEEMAQRKPSSTTPKSAERRWAERRAQIGALFPVMLLTAIAAVGWAVIVRDGQFLVAPDGRLAESLKFGFLGAYSFILQMLLRRFFQSDLKASAYTAGAVRVISVLALVGVLLWLWSNEFAPETQVALAFTVGFFPLVGMQALEKTAKTLLRVVVPTLRTDYPLSDLDGLNIWYEARLLEEGIEDMQNLATANLVEVILHTRVPVGRLVDWIDQAHLYLHLEPPRRWYRTKGGESRDTLRRYGIRTATDLRMAFNHFDDSSEESRKRICESENEELRKALRWALNRPDERGDGHVSVTQAILKTFENDPNLLHVSNWKYDWTGTPEVPAVSCSA